MKLLLSLFYRISVVLFLMTGSLMSFSQDRPKVSDDNSFEFLKHNFAIPGKAWGSAPLWVWHTKVTQTIIDSMMMEFKQNAFGGVMVHRGLITEYLSKDWFDLYQYTIKREGTGLDVWIYDENSILRSLRVGTADQMPESYNRDNCCT